MTEVLRYGRTHRMIVEALVIAARGLRVGVIVLVLYMSIR